MDRDRGRDRFTKREDGNWERTWGPNIALGDGGCRKKLTALSGLEVFGTCGVKRIIALVEDRRREEGRG